MQFECTKKIRFNSSFVVGFILAASLILLFHFYYYGQVTLVEWSANSLSERVTVKWKYDEKQTAEPAEHSRKEEVDAVILLSMTRSGSSIAGSLFNERVNVTYLYEPLFPFGR